MKGPTTVTAPNKLKNKNFACRKTDERKVSVTLAGRRIRRKVLPDTVGMSSGLFPDEQTVSKALERRNDVTAA